MPRANGVPPQLAAAVGSPNPTAAVTTNFKCKCARCEFGLIHRGGQLFPLTAESPGSPPSEPLPLVPGGTAIPPVAGGCCHRHGRVPSIESACAYDDMDKDTQVWLDKACDDFDWKSRSKLCKAVLSPNLKDCRVRILFLHLPLIEKWFVWLKSYKYDQTRCRITTIRYGPTQKCSSPGWDYPPNRMINNCKY